MSNATTRKTVTKTCCKCGRTGTRQFTYNSLVHGWTCDDYAACTKRTSK